MAARREITEEYPREYGTADQAGERRLLDALVATRFSVPFPRGLETDGLLALAVRRVQRV